MPVSDLGGGRLNIKSRLDRPSDAWSLSDVDSSRFINARRSDRVNLRVGYLDKVTMEPKRVGWIKGGRIRVYRVELTANPDGTTTEVCSLNGLDGITALLRQQVRMRYIHFPKPEVISATPEASQVPELVGQWSAKDIAAHLLTLIQGEIFSLSWGARNYQLMTDFSGVGRPIDRIAELIEPWSQVDPFAVDIYIEGKTVIVQERNPNPTPDYTFDLPDARLDRITIERQQLPIFSTVTLFGRNVASSLVDDPEQPGPDLEGGGFFSIGLSPSEKTETTTSEANADPSDPKSKSKDFSRIVVDSTFRMPDKLLIRQRKRTYAGIPSILISDEQMFSDWSPSEYNESGPVNRPICRGQTVVVEGYPNGDTRKQWQETRAEETQYNYDEQKFITSQITMKKVLNLRSGQLEPNEQVIKTYTDRGLLEVEEVTTVLRRRKRNNQNSIWYMAQRDTKPAGGYRTGGPGKGLFFAKQTLDPDDPDAPADDETSQPLSLVETISADPEAEVFEYRNDNLDATDLEFIMDQFRRASGLWAFTVQFTCPIMAWIKRGAYVQLNNVRNKDGLLLLPQQPALIIDVDLTQGEDTDLPEGTANITAMVWAEGI